MAFGGRNKFRSANDGRRIAAITVTICTTCGEQKTDAVTERCPGECHFLSIDSKLEARRAGELILLRKAKQLTELKFQPRFPLVVNGEKVGLYQADFQYIEGGRTVIEELKPPGWEEFDRLAKLKIALFNALYRSANLAVTVLVRK